MVGYRNGGLARHSGSRIVSGFPMVGYRNNLILSTLSLLDCIRLSDGGVSELSYQYSFTSLNCIRLSDGGVSELIKTREDGFDNCIRLSDGGVSELS